MDPGVIGVFIPIVAIVMGIGIGMLSIWSEHKRKAQLLEQNHRERMHAIEKGIELPPLPPNLGRHEQRAIDRHRRPSRCAAACMLLLIGIVLFFAIDTAGGREGALFGLIPAAVGIANLRVRRRFSGSKEEARDEVAERRDDASVQVGDQRGAHVVAGRREIWC